MSSENSSVIAASSTSDVRSDRGSSAGADTFDDIVIGGGLGGLTCAAYLAASGRHVLVAEKHDITGGNSMVFRRRGYEFDVGVHYIGECQVGGLINRILAGLSLEDRIRFRRMDDVFDVLVFPDRTIEIPAGWDSYRQTLAEAFPDEADAVRCVLDVLERVANAAMRRPGSDIQDLFESGLTPLTALYDRFDLSVAARGALSHWAGLYGSGPDESATVIHAILADHYMNGAFYPEGGGQMFSARLVQVIEACGGEVRVGALTEQIVADETGRVVGVRFSDGTIAHAENVISNADYRRTVLELGDGLTWSAETVERAQTARMGYPLFCVYVVIEGDFERPVNNSNFFVFGHDDIAATFGSLSEGLIDDAPFAYISVASRKDPTNEGLAPSGFTNFQIMTLVPLEPAMWGVDEGPTTGPKYRRRDDYRSAKAALQDRLLERAEIALGPFRDRIVYVESATPLTQERYTRSTAGSSYGLAHAPDAVGPLRPGYATEIPGLFLVGANAPGGHGIAGVMAGGLAAAGQVLGEDLSSSVMEGQRVLASDVVPPDGPDFDPYETARGVAMMGRRAEGRERRAARKAELG